MRMYNPAYGWMQDDHIYERIIGWRGPMPRWAGGDLNWMFGKAGTGPAGTGHWAVGLRPMEWNLALMSSRQFQNYYGINLNTNDGRWEAALAMAQPPSANYFSSYIAPALGVKGIVFGNEAWVIQNLKPAVYAGGLEAENQIAMGLAGAINILLGILKKDYLGALSMRNTQAGSQSVSQAGFLSDGTSSSLDLLIGSVAWRLGEDIDNSKGWFKGKAAWYEGWRLNNPTVNVRMPAPIPNFRISAQAALRMSTTLKVGGGILGVYGLYSTYDDFSSGKISGGEAALDAAFGVIGFFGPWGMVASATYFLVAKPLYKYATSDGN